MVVMEDADYLVHFFTFRSQGEFQDGGNCLRWRRSCRQDRRRLVRRGHLPQQGQDRQLRCR